MPEEAHTAAYCSPRAFALLGAHTVARRAPPCATRLDGVSYAVGALGTAPVMYGKPSRNSHGLEKRSEKTSPKKLQKSPFSALGGAQGLRIRSPE